MTLGYVLGNGLIVILAFIIKGYTFNLGASETVALYGLVATLSIWGAVGQITGNWSPRILYWGSILADIVAYYPLLKQ